MAVVSAGTVDVTADLSSGCGTEPGVAILLDGRLTIRMILLRKLVDEMATRQSEIADNAGLLSAYQTLAELQRAHPAEVATLLSYPHVGPWLARALQRARTWTEHDDTAPPLWADCGYLGWLAAAGSITCRPEGSMTVVVRGGVVMLPGIGMARLGPSDHFGQCELHWASDGALRFTHEAGTTLIPSLDAESDPRWLPLRRLRGADGESEILLDDLDPFRDLNDERPVPPRLTATEAHSWQRDFAAAWQLLQHDFDRYTVPMRSCLRAVTPLNARPVASSQSYTAANGLGCVYTTAPADPCQLALTLIHETQHTKFDLLTEQVLLFDPDSASRYYAPWRDDPRPILGLLHGIYAFFGVTDFWRVHRHADCHRSMHADIDFELWRVQVEGAITQAKTSGLMTDTGEQFLDALATRVRVWGEEDVPAAARLAAFEVSVAHRAFWRVRNLAPDDAGVIDLAARWAAQLPRPAVLPPSAQVEQKTLSNNYRHLHLPVQLKLLDSGAADTLSSPEQPHGDRAYLAGEYSEAVALYTRELQSDPLRPQLWAGLALALPKLYPDMDFGVLNDRTEVVARLHRTVLADTGGGEVIDLVRWLSHDTGPPG